MIFRGPRRVVSILSHLVLLAATLHAQPQAQSPSSPTPPSRKHSSKSAPADSGLDSGAVSNGVYRNKTLALSCRIPAGWVLRTDEWNTPEEEKGKEDKKAEDTSAPAPPASSAGAKVLLAAFSRPPEAIAEDINASIVIAAESAASYQLKEAAEYLFPLIEVFKAQGFTMDEDPYEVAMGSKTLVRADFHKDRGTRVMHQSTLAMLAHGYAISITVIGGTDDEVEDLIDGLTFSGPGK